MSKKKEIKTLDSEIQLAQIEKFVNDFDNAVKKDLRNELKYVALIVGVSVLSLVGLFIFKKPIIAIIGTSITSISGIVTLSKDYIKDTKSFNPNNHKTNSNIINIERKEDVNKILHNGIGKAKSEDFYSEKYKFALKKETYVETEEQKKYKETLEKQQKQKNKNYSNFKIIENDKNYLDKEETMIQIVREIDTYTFAYNLPPLKISNSQWDLFFDTTYNFFVKKGIDKEFYNSMSQVERFVLAKALLNKQNNINIYDFVKNLYYLEKEEIPKQEITILQQDMLSKLPTTKNINFSDYITLKKRK